VNLVGNPPEAKQHAERRSIQRIDSNKDEAKQASVNLNLVY
jgi:hypothetical protein